MVYSGHFARERHADLNFFFRLTIFSVSEILTKSFNEKFSFAPIPFNLGSAYASEDSKKTKKDSITFLIEDNFSTEFFVCFQCRVYSSQSVRLTADGAREKKGRKYTHT